ncbi:TPA: phage GP46 family protein [Neisseria meningitidis]|uniref:phage GP46 family protein n=1 Tax=Neisseria meningitidis TaxID=487 RepID=UPI000BB5F213|nr:phage GP46 family protein [Neisseria meningitidis]MBW3880806.1 hypothetical protein [Neisseria meningitidis]MBW4006229.1 hypothetical protein [Neisseria meningitidis]MCL5825105.1 phage GP46 family protein [Neisseria meningitidis]RPC00255.1 hypothetical protein JY21_03890 [Neisseria meningitidis]
MDALLNPATGDYLSNESAQGIENEVYVRLLTPLGSYWADPALGSRLHELRRMKDLPRIAVPARQYAEQALQPILDARRARHIDVSASSVRRGWLRLDIDGEDMSGRHLSLIHEVRLA